MFESNCKAILIMYLFIFIPTISNQHVCPVCRHFNNGIRSSETLQIRCNMTNYNNKNKQALLSFNIDVTVFDVNSIVENTQ